MPNEPTKQSVAYGHAEAFCLMRYLDEKTGKTEVLWNSRDGVTPFVIESLDGNEAAHTDWQRDIRCPDFIPADSMRVFVDALPTHSHIRRSAREYVDKFWDLDIGGGMTMRKTLANANGAQMTKGQAVDYFIAGWTKPGSPTIITGKEYNESRR